MFDDDVDSQTAVGSGASVALLNAVDSHPGMLLGTAAYMAPEQARGAEVDARADVWALGCVVCEMLTGAPLFAGETRAQVLNAVTTSSVDLAALPAETPEALRRLLRRCLARARR